MKRLTLAAVVLTLFAAGCDEKLNPAAPTAGQVTLASQMSGAANVPPAGSLEAGSTGQLSVTMTPAAGGAYTASFTFQIQGLVKAGVLPAPLDSGSVIVAAYIHQGAAGTVGPPVVQLPVSLQVPIVSPTGSVLLTISNVSVSASAASAILSNPSGFYFNMYSALNQNGVIRGQLVQQ
jgi:CHRD domain